MDNGLIFPYRQCSDPDEAGDANHPKPHVTAVPFGGPWVWGGAWDPSR